MNCNLPCSSVHGFLQTRILEGIAIPFSRRSSQPRDQTQVSCIAGRFFTVWATGKPSLYPKMGTIKDRNDRDLVDAEEIKMKWKEYTEEQIYYPVINSTFFVF